MSGSPFPRLQAVATVLTPILLGAAGLMLSKQQQETRRQLESIAQDVSAVTAWQPYIDMLSDDANASKAKMAAYALYKLNPTDKRAAVYIILAADRPEAHDVLSTIAAEDPDVEAILADLITQSDQEQRAANDPQTEDPADVEPRLTPALTQAAVEITRRQPMTGWMYIGTYRNNAWSGARQLDVGNSLPVLGENYTVNDDTYLRSDKPHLPLYKLPAARGVVKRGDTVKIAELDEDVGKDRVWALVTVQPSGSYN